MSYIKHKSEESSEDYLEAILTLEQRNGSVRSIDIANELSFSKPSVSVAMKNLKANELITVSEDGLIHLTGSGRELAKSVYEKHTLLSDWLIHLGVDPDTARDDACKMEHDISEKSFAAMKKQMQAELGRK